MVAVALILSGAQAFWVCGLLLCVFIGPTQSSARTLLLRMSKGRPDRACTENPDPTDVTLAQHRQLGGTRSLARFGVSLEWIINIESRIGFGRHGRIRSTARSLRNG
jgi:hypothetical protein